jgi:hypothetical protein
MEENVVTYSDMHSDKCGPYCSIICKDEVTILAIFLLHKLGPPPYTKGDAPTRKNVRDDLFGHVMSVADRVPGPLS